MTNGTKVALKSNKTSKVTWCPFMFSKMSFLKRIPYCETYDMMIVEWEINYSCNLVTRALFLDAPHLQSRCCSSLANALSVSLEMNFK